MTFGCASRESCPGSVVFLIEVVEVGVGGIVFPIDFRGFVIGSWGFDETSENAESLVIECGSSGGNSILSLQ